MPPKIALITPVYNRAHLLAPTTLATTAAYLDTHPETGMVYTNYHIIDAQGNDHGHRCTIPTTPSNSSSNS
jgi:hypothetical protein